MTSTAEPTMRSRSTFGPRPERLIIALVAYLLYTGHALSRWRQHRVAGFDLGIFDQVVRNYAHLEAPIVSLKGPSYNVWGDHFHPILVVLAPLYHVWDDARVLLVAQAGLVALSVWVVHGFASRHLDRRSAAFAAVAYALGWPLQRLVDYDFHEIAFAIPLLVIAVDALDRRSDRVLVAASVLLLLTREDMGLLVFCLGVLRVLHRPRLPGLALIVLGPLTFAAVTKVVLPHFDPAGTFAYWTYEALGPDLPSSLAFIVAHPITTIGVALNPPIKLTKLLLLLAPVAFLALRSRYFLLAVPLLAESLLSSRSDLWGTAFHHSSVLWPPVFLAAVHGAALMRLPARRWAWCAVGVVVLAFPVVGMLSGGQNFPLHRLFTGEAFAGSDRARDGAAIIEAIPANTCVEADDNVTVFLTHTNLVSVRGHLGRPPDFYAIDLGKPEMVEASPRQVRQEALAAGYTEVVRRGQLVLLRSPGYRGPTADCAPS